MLDSYKLFPIHALLLMFLLSSILLFKKIFPRKKLSMPLLLLLFSLLPVISIFRKGVYESGDFSLHIYRAMDFYTSLSQGIIMPSWASGLNNGFGYPLFIFLNPLPYYLISLFHGIGFTFISSMKLFLAFSYVSSGFTMYLFTRKLLKSNFAAFSASIFYLYSPYHLIDLHFRVAVGEILIFVFFPLLLLGIVNLCDKFSFSNILFVVLSIILIVNSHQALAFFCLLFSISLFVYLLFVRAKNKIAFSISYLISLSIGLLGSFHLLFPYLYYSSFTIKGEAYSMSFTSLKELLISPYRWGFLYQGPNGELTTPLGLTQIIIFSLSILLIIKKNKWRKNVIFFSATTLLLIFLILPYSEFVWEKIPLIKIMILTYRLMLISTATISVLAGIILCLLNKKISWIMITLTIALSLLNWGNRSMISNKNDNALINEMPGSSSSVEGWWPGIPKWRGAVKFEEMSREKGLIDLSNNSTVDVVSKSVDQKIYIVKLPKESLLVENTWYFPGWSVFSNNRRITIYPNNKVHPGAILFSLPKGEHKVKIIYKDLPIFSFVKMVSSVVIILCLLLLTTAFLLKRRNNTTYSLNV